MGGGGSAEGHLYHYTTHYRPVSGPLGSAAPSIISPKPLLPPGSARTTTAALEHQASISLATRGGLSSIASGNMAGNSRVAQWAEAIPRGQIPPDRTGSPYTTGLSPPTQQMRQGSPAAFQQQYGSMQPPRSNSYVPPRQMPQPPASSGIPPDRHSYNTASPPNNSNTGYARMPQPVGPAAGPPVLPRVNVNGSFMYDTPSQQSTSAAPPPSQHPPRASSMYTMSSSTPLDGGKGYASTSSNINGNSNVGGSTAAYDAQYNNRHTLHHSFSDLNLNPTSGSSSNYTAYAANNPSNLSSSTSRLNPYVNGSNSSLSTNDTARHPRAASMAGPSMPTSNLSASTSRPVSSASMNPTGSGPGVDPNDTLASSLGPSSVSSSTAALCIALPTQSDLAQQRESAQYAPNPAAARVSWAKSVLKFVERHQACSAGGEYSKITDPTLVKWTDEAIRLILSTADNVSSNPVPEALYLRGELSSSGKFPSYRSKDLSMAFRDFEMAANMGCHAAWAKIALAYETYGEQNKSQADFERAKRAYEEGVQKNEVTCVYRIGMANLLGQLGFPANATVALPLLRKAASYATVDDPLPAYIYGMLLAGELDLGANVTSSITPNLLLDENGRTQKARPWIERSAYLGYAPAQFKMGFNYEYATMGCGYDPLLSVQYYSLASQQGDIEADMALSKWFLCGSEAFDLQETLAFTFAEKAAKRGLPSAEFALGYYYEIGIGGRKDIDLSKKWYTKASSHGNKDAADRLASLKTNSENVLSRTEHEAQMNDKIVRKRTQAKADADSRRRKEGGSSVSATPPSLPSLPSMPSMPTQYKPSSSTYAAGAAPRPPRGSSAEYGSAQAPSQHRSQGSYDAPMPFPSVMPTTDSNVSLRRQDTMRSVKRAAAAVAQGQSFDDPRYVQGGMPAASPNDGSARPQHRASNGSGTSSSRMHAQPQNGLAPPQPGPGHIRRYSLVDSGPAAPSSVSVQSSQSSASSTSGVPIVKTGPQTFEDMGLKTGKVKADQECIIM